MFVEVVLRTLSRTLDQVYTYSVPTHWGVPVSGDRVVVPFGGGDRYMEGVVWRCTETPPAYDTKPIAALLDARYRMTRSQMLLMQGIRKFYGATFSQSFQCVLPSLQQLVVQTHYRIASQEWGTIGEVVEEAVLLQRGSKAKLQKACTAGQLIKTPLFDFKETARVAEFVAFVGDDLQVALSQIPGRQIVAKRIITHMHGVKRAELKAVVSAAAATRKAIMNLVGQGLLEYQVLEPSADPLSHGLRGTSSTGDGVEALPPLTDDQAEVVARFWKRPLAVLDGITGSGKTRVYLELSRQVLQMEQPMAADAGQVLVLVPEIALTPQLVARFSKFLNTTVAVLHSRVSNKDRIDYYRRIQQGEVRVVIGARSALFAPFKSLALIILDEEHESSYRSDVQPQYDARELALLLGQSLPCGVLFGSASPSGHRMAMVQSGVLERLVLNRRIGAATLPTINVVDLRMTPQLGPLLTTFMLEGLRETFDKGEQAILLHNRKGFARYVQCTQCGHVEKCVNCDIPMTVYQQGKHLNCHYCSYQQPGLSQCSQCGGVVESKGFGLEQVVDALKAHFPQVAMRALDGDSAGKQDQLISALSDFQSEALQLLVGTQLLAKGLDFPKVTFVGVLLADQMLNLPDYAASERAMQMLLQVSGRAGRADAPGKVLIQTYQPEHWVIQQVVRHDYSGYIQQELPLRQVLGYPPYGQLYSIRVLGDTTDRVRQQAERIYHFYQDNFTKQRMSVQIFPPKPAYYGKIKNKYVYQMVLKADNDLHTRLVKLFYLGLVKNQYALVNTDCHVDFSVNPTF